MGACLTVNREDAVARRRSEEIDRQLAALAKQETTHIKILLLGAGESGKSTLVKQMKIIHSDGFAKEELLSFRPTVMDNLLASMKYVLSGMGLLRINLETSKNKIYAQTILSSKTCFDADFQMLPSIAEALQTLWNDMGVKLAVARGYEYQLNDSALYLFENMERICSEKYVPTSTDVLRARVRTNGILETNFRINDTIITMLDVGGQRSQRRKWIYCFENVKAVLFVVALSGYDMTLIEDPQVNRLEESLSLFSQIVNNRHLRHYFPDYKGKDYDVDNAALFIQHKLSSKNLNSAKLIYTHYCTATDTSNVQVVFQVVMDTVMRDNLARVTLL
ncbi:hypothetical protein RUM44_010688 [Polyplax serrata]|uniref:Guanine nucleotide-binding protein G(O) subunit alpha n=1 Tax=Polyplax serrata TaxID=468196 RepID=A0ABR1AMX1_POLSC